MDNAGPGAAETATVTGQERADGGADGGRPGVGGDVGAARQLQLRRRENEHPGADLQALRTLIRETRRERAAERPPKHFRDLFRLLRDAMQAKPAA